VAGDCFYGDRPKENPVSGWALESFAPTVLPGNSDSVEEAAGPCVNDSLAKNLNGVLPINRK
jgi:hypothetical protein